MIIEDIFEYDQVFVQVIADELAGGYGVSIRAKKTIVRYEARIAPPYDVVKGRR